MKPLLTLATTAGAAAVLAACGGSSLASTPANAPVASTAQAKTVSEKHFSGVGNVLVDSAGKALYANNVEAGGHKIVCTTGCTAFWKPLTIRAGKPTGSAGVGKLGVTSRPGGVKQVTVAGKPLYTFVEDSSGKATGNGFKDSFNGHHFTWHVVHPGGKTSGSSGGGSTTTTGGGYSTTTSGPYSY